MHESVTCRDDVRHTTASRRDSQMRRALAIMQSSDARSACSSGGPAGDQCTSTVLSARWVLRRARTREPNRTIPTPATVMMALTTPYAISSPLA